MNCWYNNIVIILSFISLLTCLLRCTREVYDYVDIYYLSNLLLKRSINHPFIDVEVTPSDVEKTNLLNELFWHPDDILIEHMV